MPKTRVSIALIGLVLAATPAVAQPAAPTARAAAQPHGRTLVIPAALRATVSTNSGALVIRMNDGSPHRIDINELTVEQFESFAGGRFIGFAFFGNETYGYILVDRTKRGELAEVHSGGRPSFSEGDRHFAAAEISGSGFGNLNGVALWEVLPTGMKRLFYTDSVRAGFDWRAEAFRQPNCVPITAVEEGWEPTAPNRWDAEVANAPRAWYELRWSDEAGIFFGRSTDTACFDDTSG